MSKRALIIYRINKSDISNTGVINKLRGQVHGLQAAGYETDYIVHDQVAIYKNQERIHTFSNRLKGVIRKFQFYKHLPSFSNYDIIIVRYGLSTPHFVKWLRGIKESSPRAYIIIDMPTYPYRQEWQGIKGSVVAWMDDRYKSTLHRYVDLMLHSGSESEIWQIPTYHMTNGVMGEEDRPPVAKAEDTLRMIAIGKWQYWHGLDRLLHGLSEYKAAYHLDVVGDGPVLASLKALSIKLDLDDHITWHGVMTGARLNQFIDQAHLGIGTLGLHRKEVAMDSSLKHRTYCARGLPFTLSTTDSDFEASLTYVKYMPADESPIDITELSSFVGRIDYGTVAPQMMAYARERLSWITKMKALIAHIEEA